MADEKKKICPLTYTLGKGAYDQEVPDFDYCVKEKCEYWVPSEGCCSVRLIAIAINHISNHSKFQ